MHALATNCRPTPADQLERSATLPMADCAENASYSNPNQICLMDIYNESHTEQILSNEDAKFYIPGHRFLFVFNVFSDGRSHFHNPAVVGLQCDAFAIALALTLTPPWARQTAGNPTKRKKDRNKEMHQFQVQLN